MKTFLTLPKDEGFYNRYATLIPTLNILGYLAQVVSALTEFGIIYSLIYSSLADFWPAYAPTGAGIGAVVGTLFIEIGLRKFGPYSVRAILGKRFTGLDAWMTGFIIACTVGLLIASGALSFKGSKSLVEAVAPEAEQKDSAAADSLASDDRAQALASWQADSLAIAQRYAPQLNAIATAAKSRINAEQTKLETLRKRERAGNGPYPTQRAKIVEQIAAIEADRDAQLASLEAERAKELGEAQRSRKSSLERIETRQEAARDSVEVYNAGQRAKVESKVKAYGGGLAYFTILCLAVFLLSVALKEIHRAGSGIDEKAEPGAFAFEAGLWESFSHAISSQFERKAYGVAHWIEGKVKDAPEPNAAPTIWERSGSPIRRQVVGNPTPPADGQPVKQRPFSLPNRDSAGNGCQRTGSPSAGDPSTPSNAGQFPAAELADLDHLADVAMGYIQSEKMMEGINHHREAETLRLKAEEVLTMYLGPYATPEAVNALYWDCIHHLNGEGPNPFEGHHRRKIGFSQRNASDTAGDAPNAMRYNAPSEQPTDSSQPGKRIGPCKHCGKDFTMRTTWHKYCSEDCRKAYHAQRHNGQPFDPAKQPGRKRRKQ